MWFATLTDMPRVAQNPSPMCPRAFLFASEKAAINAARKLRIAEIDRLQKEVNVLDERYDAIEDAEMKGE